MKDDLKIRRFQKHLREGKARIVFAPQKKVENYEKELDVILEVLGHPEALITDESSVGDFTSVGFFRQPLTKRIAKRKQLEVRYSKLLGMPVALHDLLVDVAERLRTKQEADHGNV